MDIKQIKAKLIDDRIYFFIRFYGQPVWPNYAHVSDYNGIPVYRHRGYYPIIADLDNNVATGWDTFYYMWRENTVGYRHSISEENAKNIGAEAMFLWCTNMGFTAPHPDSGKVKEIEYSAEDVTYVCGPTEIGGRLYCFEFDVPKPDSLKQFSRQGTYFDTFVNKDIWVGHAWGEDFLEMGFQIDAVKNYWKRLGFDYFLPGDTIGLAGFVETPIDDWGTDFTSRGELIVGTSSSISSTKTTKTSDAVKLNNYPNPFNQETTIRYSISQSAYLSLEIFNTSGQKITTLIQGEIQAGLHQIKWDGKNEAGLPLASGIYLVSLKAESLSLVQRTLLIK